MKEALYRKYRPKKFKDVVGQDHIVKVLEAEVASGEISHAYLFSGTKGTGKTSLARIFADAIGTTQNDIFEIDAASNTSVEDIRALNEAVFVLPFESKYKVYILDEVHMLSKSAANALLKTLEEPPSHVIFILATTETHKIPETVLSRCEVFSFKKPSQEVLKKNVLSIAKKEGTTIDDAGAELIAILGDGSFRDTQGTLQKVLSYSKGKVSEEDVRVVTGAPAVELVHGVVEAIANKDLQLGLSTIHKAVSQNIDIGVFLKLILHTMRAVLLVRFGAGEIVKSDLSDKEYAFAEKIAKSDTKINSQTLVELLTAYENTRGSYISELPLELALIKIIENK